MKYPATIKAYAKLNLTLDVLGRRADGFHELCTIMQKIELFDELSADFGCNGVSVRADTELPPNSVAYRAAYEYCRRTGAGGASITIRTHIPQMAGLGGSSADGAGVLQLMQQHYGAMDEAELFALAAELGSDVPFLLGGQLALCRGRGEIMQPLPPREFYYVIVKPAQGISTRELFAALKPPYAPPRSNAALDAILRGDNAALCANVSNALAPAAEERLGEIAAIKRRLLAAGALAAEMSGSGSACFGIFPNMAKAQAAKAAFADMPWCHICKSVHGMV